MVLVIRLDDISCGRKKGWMIFCVVDSKIGGRRELQRGLKSSSKSLWCSEPISLYCREVVVVMMMMMVMMMMIMTTINDDGDDDGNGDDIGWKGQKRK